MEVLNDFTTSVRRAFDEIDPDWEGYDGLVVCGTHTPRNIESMIDKIHQARTLKRPFLGICFGHQLYAIEYARHMLGIKNATSEEFSKKGTFVVKKRPFMKVGLHDGESWWNNYEVVIPLEYPPLFYTVQYHPEYNSSLLRPHPVLTEFLETCQEYTNLLPRI